MRKWNMTECAQCQGKGHSYKINPDWLMWVRKKAGVTQAELAAGLEIAAPSISQIESGVRACPTYVQRAYEDLLENA